MNDEEYPSIAYVVLPEKVAGSFIECIPLRVPWCCDVYLLRISSSVITMEGSTSSRSSYTVLLGGYLS
jgi:hypothetical protein